MQGKSGFGGDRQLLVACDAMEWNLVHEWARAGYLPTFRHLIEQGSRAILSTTAAQLPDTVWGSICTGCNPAKFEKYFYVQYNPDTQGLRHVRDDAIRRPPFWDYLTKAGCKVCAVDVAKFPISSSINGCQVTNWGAHATKTERKSTPSSLMAQIDAKFGRHPVGDCDRLNLNPNAMRDLRQRILDGVRLHGKLFRWLMKEYEWDVFIAGISAPHCIGHHFWRWCDPTRPEHGDGDPDGLADSIRLVYQAIDREIGEMLEQAGPDTRCLVLAGHGMGPLRHASWNLTEMLELWGYGPNPVTRVSQRDGAREARVNPWRLLKMKMPGTLQYAIKDRLPQRLQDELLFRWYRGGKDWSRYRAFAVPNNDTVGAIRIGVKGRDRYGLVEPGAEYDRICADIQRALLELTDPVSGRPVVRRVTLSRDEFRGEFLHQLPDITVLWEIAFAWNSLRSPRFGTLHIRQQDGRSGSHSDHGFLLMAGPGIPAGAVMSDCSVYDIAPTVLEHAGVPVPSDFDGRPIAVALGECNA